LERDEAAGWAAGCRAWIHLGPLGLVPRHLAALGRLRVERVVAFGSTSRFTKTGSSHPKERRIVAELEQGEAALAQGCAAHGIGWALFRPTLIHGCGLDRNVMVVAAAIRRFGFFPLIGDGRGRRQPVHADDLAQACVAALAANARLDRAYDLSGGEVLSYREMVTRIFAALARPPRLVSVPVPALGLVLWGLSRLPRFRDFNVEMARRMADDMVFAHDAAAHDLGYAPRGFDPVVQRPSGAPGL
ncbi:MAG: NAD(P)-dependent oxidoreductase, partial [Proteobacteria bacterium]|nr:NAD(P)-dependent oxidoreductase [Burkholderiales bacterium]